MSKNHFLPLSLLACIPLLASCSTIINGSTQQVMFKAEGADDVYCDARTGVNDYRFIVRPPAKVWVQRAKEPIYLDCNAPGNRVVHTKVPSNLAEASYLNAVTAGTTLAWDATSGAMYEYPDVVVIDFTNSVARNQPLPAYENRGALDPRAQGIEYMGADTPVLESDKDLAARYKAAYDDARQEDAEAAANAAERERRIESVEGGFYGDKGGKSSTKPTPSTREVQIAPLSEAAPARQNASPTATAVSGEGAYVPQANPQLGKPIFPQSTTFNR